MSTRSMIFVEKTNQEKDEPFLLSLYKHSDGYPHSQGNAWLIYHACRDIFQSGEFASAEADTGPKLVQTICNAGWKVEIEEPWTHNDIKNVQEESTDLEYLYVMKTLGKTISVRIDEKKFMKNSYEWKTIYDDDWKNIPKEIPIYNLTPEEIKKFDKKSKNMTYKFANNIVAKEPRFFIEIPEKLIDREIVLTFAEGFQKLLPNLEKFNISKFYLKNAEEIINKLSDITWNEVESIIESKPQNTNDCPSM